MKRIKAWVLMALIPCLGTSVFAGSYTEDRTIAEIQAEVAIKLAIWLDKNKSEEGEVCLTCHGDGKKKKDGRPIGTCDACDGTGINKTSMQEEPPADEEPAAVPVEDKEYDKEEVAALFTEQKPVEAGDTEDAKSSEEKPAEKTPPSALEIEEAGKKEGFGTADPPAAENPPAVENTPVAENPPAVDDAPSLEDAVIERIDSLMAPAPTQEPPALEKEEPTPKVTSAVITPEDYLLEVFSTVNCRFCTQMHNEYEAAKGTAGYLICSRLKRTVISSPTYDGWNRQITTVPHSVLSYKDEGGVRRQVGQALVGYHSISQINAIVRKSITDRSKAFGSAPATGASIPVGYSLQVWSTDSMRVSAAAPETPLPVEFRSYTRNAPEAVRKTLNRKTTNCTTLLREGQLVYIWNFSPTAAQIDAVIQRLNAGRS